MTIASASVGFAYGHVSGLIRALQKNEDGITLNEGQISVIATSMTFCVVIGIYLLALCGDRIGRRWSLILLSTPMLLSWMLVYLATGFTTLMLSRIFAGTSAGGLIVVNMIGAAEYTCPNTRAFYQSIISMVASSLGIGIGHVLGVLYHWRTLAVFGMVVSTIHICLPYFCVESPQWLASKGRFKECEIAFRKLHGMQQKAEDELRLLINMEDKKLKVASELKMNNGCKKMLDALKKKYFWGLLLTYSFVYIYYAAAGKVIFTNLATVMLEEMTGTSDILLFTLIVDGFILIGTCASCVLIKKMSVRVLLFSSGYISNGVLLVLSVSMYFKNDEKYYQWINVILLALYFIIVHAGPYPVMDVLLGELFPLDIKLYCYLLCSPMLLATVCVSIMIMPMIVSAIGYHGLFLLNSVVVFICLGYFWVKMPETKGKTLQEIEVYFKTNEFNVDKVVVGEQIKSLV
ncbi:uncharacterized protein LOC112048801 [Bicyclus anynana]|uniref:Uncharacterized protein LOC112048801 n=1 Tax=Bicyclus anynana TaxID=110368 RepID=A0A6J1N5W0_BICAN|nr:uncharacterized protein LOC112048801 [Bicyclus anynana]